MIVVHSCFYEGWVRHRRRGLIAHSFRYRLFLAYVDLTELETLFGRLGLWSTAWPTAARFLRADHLGDPKRPLDDCVRDLVEAELGWRPQGPIRLLTHFRYFGFQMNPVSLYYCFDEAGRELRAMVAEVNNTPWRERHCYVLDLRSVTARRRFQANHPKSFHVSPFLHMKLNYHWRIGVPGDRLVVNIDAREEQAPLLDATLMLRRLPLSRWQQFRLLLRFPLMTLRVYQAIHWQALLLWLKGVSVMPHPKRIYRSTAAEGKESEKDDLGGPRPSEPSSSKSKLMEINS